MPAISTNAWKGAALTRMRAGRLRSLGDLGVLAINLHEAAKGQPVERVECLPFFAIIIARGGNPSPNSSTRIPESFAARKCPNSCTTMSATITTTKLKSPFRLLGYLGFFLLQNIRERVVAGVDEFLNFYFQTCDFILPHTAGLLCGLRVS